MLWNFRRNLQHPRVYHGLPSINFPLLIDMSKYGVMHQFMAVLLGKRRFLSIVPIFGIGGPPSRRWDDLMIMGLPEWGHVLSIFKIFWCFLPWVAAALVLQHVTTCRVVKNILRSKWEYFFPCIVDTTTYQLWALENQHRHPGWTCCTSTHFIDK